MDAIICSCTALVLPSSRLNNDNDDDDVKIKAPEIMRKSYAKVWTLREELEKIEGNRFRK